MRAAAPSVFAEGKHESRSERYTYIPTIEVLRGLRKEGFEPFMVAQGASRIEGKAEFTKHLVRLGHAGQVQTRPEANEIILINSHDGASSYQLLAGAFRFVCHNGLVVGDVVEDIRIPHRGDVQGEVIDGAFRVLDEFEVVDEHVAAMKTLRLDPPEEVAFATAALALRSGERGVEESGGHRPEPVTAEQLNEARRIEDVGHDLWNTFQRVSENVMEIERMNAEITRDPMARAALQEVAAQLSTRTATLEESLLVTRFELEDAEALLAALLTRRNELTTLLAGLATQIPEAEAQAAAAQEALAAAEAEVTMLLEEGP